VPLYHVPEGGILIHNVNLSLVLGGKSWISKTSKKPFQAFVWLHCFQGQASPLQGLPVDEAAGPAQVALNLKKRKLGSPGEADLRPAQLAPRKRRNQPEKAGKMPFSPVQEAPKNRRKKQERAAEAAASSSAVCTAHRF
jgi:hypothetical protein